MASLNRLNVVSAAKLIGWLDANWARIETNRLKQKDAALLAAQELGFTVTVANLARLVSEMKHPWPSAVGDRHLNLSAARARRTSTAPIVSQPDISGLTGVLADLQSEIAALRKDLGQVTAALEIVAESISSHTHQPQGS